jgi:hypothetical protein
MAACRSGGRDDVIYDVIVVGGGVVGACLARALAALSSSSPSPSSAPPPPPSSPPAVSIQGGGGVLLLERCEIAAAASGRAGGFLARDWSAGPLGALSFDLHAELAREYNGSERWGYRRLSALAVPAGGTLAKSDEGKTTTRLRGGRVKQAPWLDGALSEKTEVLGTEDTLAQVTPVSQTNASLRRLKTERGKRSTNGLPSVCLSVCLSLHSIHNSFRRCKCIVSLSPSLLL